MITIHRPTEQEVMEARQQWALYLLDSYRVRMYKAGPSRAEVYLGRWRAVVPGLRWRYWK